jgi:hypothetical protein
MPHRDPCEAYAIHYWAHVLNAVRPRMSFGSGGYEELTHISSYANVVTKLN